MSLKVLSFFSGIGGFDAAFLAAGHRVVGACEIDEAARKVYAARFGEPAWFPRDIAAVTPEEIPDADAWVGGPPCQSFSVAGARGGMDDHRGNLFAVLLDLAAQRRPPLLVLENVPGLLSSSNGRDFGGLLAQMLRATYRVAWATLDARHFSVAQRRRRVFICASLVSDPRAVLFDAGAAPRSQGAPDAVLRDGAWTSPQAGLFGSGDAPFAGASWPTSGYAAGDSCWTRDVDEEREGAARASLANTLERGAVHPRFYLSPKACAGILRRAARRGRDLPSALAAALHATATGTDAPPQSEQLAAVPNGIGPVSPTLRTEYGRDWNSPSNPSGPLIVGADASAQGDPKTFESRFARNGRGAPSDVVAALKAQAGADGRGDASPLVMGFYPTGGTRDVQASDDESPAIKVGSGVGIPSAPAVAFGGGRTSGPRDEATALSASNERIDFDTETFVLDSASALQGGGRRGHRIDAEGAAGGQLVVAPLFIHANKGRPAGRASAHEPDVHVEEEVSTLATDGHAQSALFVPDTSPSLRASDGGERNDFRLRRDGMDPLVVDDLAPTIRAADGHHGRSSPRGDGSDALVVVPDVVAGQQHGSDVGNIGALRAGHGDVQSGVPFVVSFGENQRGEVVMKDDAPALGTGGGKPGSGYAAVLAIESPGRKMSGGARTGDGVKNDEAYALDADPRVQAVVSVDLQNTRFGEPDLAGTLDTTRPTRGGGQAVVAFQADASSTAYGVQPSSEVSPTLDVGKRVAVAGFNQKAESGTGGNGYEEGIAPPLRVENPGAVVAFGSKDHGQDAAEDESPTIRRGASAEHRPNGGVAPAVSGAGAIRRLTASECERLQGGVDGWTCLCGVACKKQYDRRVPAWWPAEVNMGGCGHAACGCKCSDGPRYRQLGNSVAVPVVNWIARRLA